MKNRIDSMLSKIVSDFSSKNRLNVLMKQRVQKLPIEYWDQSGDAYSFHEKHPRIQQNRIYNIFRKNPHMIGTIEKENPRIIIGSKQAMRPLRTRGGIPTGYTTLDEDNKPLVIVKNTATPYILWHELGHVKQQKTMSPEELKKGTHDLPKEEYMFHPREVEADRYAAEQRSLTMMPEKQAKQFSNIYINDVLFNKPDKVLGRQILKEAKEQKEQNIKTFMEQHPQRDAQSKQGGRLFREHLEKEQNLKILGPHKRDIYRIFEKRPELIHRAKGLVIGVTEGQGASSASYRNITNPENRNEAIESIAIGKYPLKSFYGGKEFTGVPEFAIPSQRIEYEKRKQIGDVPGSYMAHELQHRYDTLTLPLEQQKRETGKRLTLSGKIMMGEMTHKQVMKAYQNLPDEQRARQAEFAPRERDIEIPQEKREETFRQLFDDRESKQVNIERRQYYQRPEVIKRKKEQAKIYYQRPEVKARTLQYMKEYMKQYQQRPGFKEKQREYARHSQEKMKQDRLDIKKKREGWGITSIMEPKMDIFLKSLEEEKQKPPQVLTKQAEYMRQYHQRPEVKERIKQYQQRPGFKEKKREYLKHAQEKMKQDRLDLRERKESWGITSIMEPKMDILLRTLEEEERLKQTNKT